MTKIICVLSGGMPGMIIYVTVLESAMKGRNFSDWENFQMQYQPW